MAKQRKVVSVAIVQATQSTQIEQPSQEPGDEIAKLAYSLWQARGCPHGSSEEDWFTAEREMQNRV